MEFAKSLIGIKYIWWIPNGSEEMFYTEELPSVDELTLKGTNCSGFVNILRQKYGNRIPSIKDIPEYIVKGGTSYWYELKKNLMKPFDIKCKYPMGTLLFRKYRNKYDQGHMAIICDTETKQIIHCYYENKEYNGIDIHSLEQSHWYIPEGYYEFILYPDDWLN